MDFKKRKDFTLKKEDGAFSKRRKSKSINKELFVSLFLFSKVGKIQLWLSSSIEQFDF